MKSSSRYFVAVAAIALCVGAVGAMRGVHQPTGNTGYLGSDQAGVYGVGTIGVGGSGGNTGVSGYGSQTGVVGEGDTWGVFGLSPGATGVQGRSGTNTGVAGVSVGTDARYATGVVGVVNTVGVGVYGLAPVASGNYAGYFSGNVAISGTLMKAAGTFKIDHPQDPTNRYLSHSFVESPDMKNVYDGVVTLDRDGSATVELPTYFEALNKDFRYQLTPIGEHAPLYVAEEVKDNRFKIAGGYRDMRVSWQVTGIRHDRYALAHPIQVEEMKPQHELGRLMHPAEFGQPASMAVDAERTRSIQIKPLTPRPVR